MKSSQCTQSQRGVALIISLIMLLLITMLGIAMYKGVTQGEQIAGNVREKQRSLQSAESALRFGEWWLANSGSGTGSECDGVHAATDTTQMKICSTPLSEPEETPWPNRFDYAVRNMTVSTDGGLSDKDANGHRDVNYHASPSIYIYYKGLSKEGNYALYQVTAVGYGGAPNSASVLQSTYAVQAKSTPLDGP